MYLNKSNSFNDNSQSIFKKHEELKIKTVII